MSLGFEACNLPQGSGRIVALPLPERRSDALVSTPMFTFSRCLLDPARHELLRDGVRVDVQPLVLALLVHLASNPGRLITKDELVDAVWNGEHVSDEVIARAVMKARRAIGDNARAPVHLFTELGRGYRFALASAALPASGESPADPPHGLSGSSGTPTTGNLQGAVWRVLPFVNRSDNPALEWTVGGLQRLLHHALEAASHVTAVVSDPVGEGDFLQPGPPASRIARATSQRPVDSMVTGDIEEAPGGFVMRVAWKAPGQSVSTLILDGADLPTLVLRAAAYLAPPAPWQAEVARTHPQAWARLNASIAHIQRWPRGEVAARLQRCYAALPQLPRLLLQQADLLIQLGEFERGEAVAAAARDALAGDRSAPDDIEATLFAMVLLNEASKRRGDLRLAARRIDEALDFVARHESRLRPGLQLAMLWQQAYFVRREAGDFAEAAGHLERAILLSIRAGLLDQELRYRSSLAVLLAWQGEPHRAEDALRQVIVRSAEAGDRAATSAAMAMLGSIMDILGRSGDTVHWARKALAVGLASAVDRRVTADSRAALIEGLITHGDLGAAQRSLDWRRRFKPAVSSTVHDLGVMSNAAWIWWRRGRLEDSAELYRQVLQDERFAVWTKWANYLRSEYATLLALLGRVGEAHAALDGIATVLLPAVVGRARAAVAMAEGRRAAARDGLCELIPLTKQGDAGAHLLVIDLAWLLLEDGDDAQAESLIDRSIAMDSDAIGVRWVRLALQDRTAGGIERSEWEALRAASPSLVRHCPPIGTEADVQARRGCTAARLPNLLTVLSW